MKTYFKAFGVFKFPTPTIYIGRCVYGYPYFRPHRGFGQYFKIGYVSLGWKDKFNSPRHEWNPMFYIHLWKWQIVLQFGGKDDMDYWEQLLWYVYYSHDYNEANPKELDIVLAIKNWGEINYDTKESTWDKRFLTKKTNDLLRTLCVFPFLI